MKNVIVFGGSGFLGSHVADELTDRGYNVTIFDIIKSPYIKDNQKMIVGDILNLVEVDDAIKNQDIIYNFAAEADIENLYSPDLIRKNILGNSIILEGCSNNEIERFVFASTIYVYSDKGLFYTTSKKACESFIENYNELYGLPYTILRYGSLYGPRANEFNTIHRFIKEALTDRKIIRYGDGEEIREYIHVKDAAKLSVDILSDEYINIPITITGNQPMRIKDILIMIREILKNNIDVQYIPSESREHHYTITPYIFNPRSAKKLVSDKYHDLGQGILECIKDEYDDK